MHENNPLRHLKPSEWRARRIGKAAAKSAADSEARTQWFHEQQKERQNRRPAGPGLKEYQVDFTQIYGHESYTSLTGRAPDLESSMYKALQVEKKKHADIVEPDFKKLSGNALYAYAIMSGNRVDNQLGDWLAENTPQNAYFTPDMVAEAVAGHDGIEVTTDTRDGLSIWNFSHTESGQSFEMSRTSDGSEPTQPTNPYLVAHYWDEYDFDTLQVVSTPKLSDASVYPERPDNYRTLNSTLGLAIAQALDLNNVRIDQEIAFTFKGPQATTYMTPHAGGLEPEYVRVPSSVVAHLPGAEL